MRRPGSKKRIQPPVDLHDREAQEEAVLDELSVRSENDRRKLVCNLAVRFAAAPPAERAAAGERTPGDNGLRLDKERLRDDSSKLHAVRERQAVR